MSKIDRQVIVVLPAYNEEKNLPPLVEKLSTYFQTQQLRWSLVVVDDGSADGTAAFLQSVKSALPLSVITHSPNQGLGPTIRDGLKFAANSASADDVVVTMDADETHDPNVITELLRAIGEGASVSIASRYVRGALVTGVPRLRLLLSVGASFLFRLACPINGVKDFTSGFRAYRADLLKQAFSKMGDDFVHEKGFQCMAEILMKLRGMRPQVTEVPISLRYELKAGGSKMKVVKTALNTLRILVKYR